MVLTISLVQKPPDMSAEEKNAFLFFHSFHSLAKGKQPFSHSRITTCNQNNKSAELILHLFARGQRITRLGFVPVDPITQLLHKFVTI